MNAAKVLEDLKRRFPNEPEYHQAVEEVLSTIEEEYNKHPEFDKVNLIVTDIEMPEMDGHRLTKLIKTDPRLKKIPVVIFSSLIDEQMRKKGKELGADEQLTKPEIGHLVMILDELLAKFMQNKPEE